MKKLKLTNTQWAKLDYIFLALTPFPEPLWVIPVLDRDAQGVWTLAYAMRLALITGLFTLAAGCSDDFTVSVDAHFTWGADSGAETGEWQDGAWGGDTSPTTDAGADTNSDAMPTCTAFPADAGFMCNPDDAGLKRIESPSQFCRKVLYYKPPTPAACQCKETYNCACLLAEMPELNNTCSFNLKMRCSDMNQQLVVWCE
jgi:hypothetical protein